MSVFSNIRGIVGSLFMIGRSGPNIKDSSGVIEFRNNGDSAYAVARAADPVGNNDLVTKQYYVANPPTGAAFNPGIYNTGQDGNQALSGSTVLSLTRDSYYDTISFTAGFSGAIVTNGYELRCKVLDLRNCPAGTIRVLPVNSNGGNGGNAAAGVAGTAGAAPTAVGGGTLDGGITGWPGQIGSDSTNMSMPAGFNATSYGSYLVWGGYGGQGGSGGAGYFNQPSPGNGTSSYISNYLPLQYIYPLILTIQHIIYTPYGGMQAGQSASGGGGTNGVNRGYGGGSGACGNSAGILRIYAQQIITDGTTAAGCITVAGGNGGNGGNGAISGTPSFTGGGGGGGGTGGAGGYVELWYATRTGSAVTNLINISGGSGGNGGTGIGTYGTAGGGGYAGGQGRCLIANSTTGVIALTNGNPAAVASVGSVGATNAAYVTF